MARARAGKIKFHWRWRAPEKKALGAGAGAWSAPGFWASAKALKERLLKNDKLIVFGGFFQRLYY